MIEFSHDPPTARVFDLDRMRSAVPNYQWSELPKRLRREWPFPVEDEPAVADDVEAAQAHVDPREYWQLQRAE